MKNTDIGPATEASERAPRLLNRFGLLTWVALSIAAAGLVAYIALILMARLGVGNQAALTFEPKPDLPVAGGKTAPHVVVAQFVRVVEANAGRVAVPETELPFPREEIRQAIMSSPDWARDFHKPGGPRFFGALFVELENFVPDSRMEQRVLWEKQKDAIAKLGFQYRYIAYRGARPIPAGQAHRALTAMLHERELQYLGFMAFFSLLGCFALKMLFRLCWWLLRKPLRPLRGVGIFYFYLTWFLSAPVLLVADALVTYGDSATATSSVNEAMQSVAPVVALATILLLFSVAFDLLAYRWPRARSIGARNT